MARLYANENFPREVVEALRALGHDVLTVLEAGNAGQGISDEEVLGFAAAQGRTVITLNRRDFIRLHLSQPEHAGIIVCSQAERIHEAITSIESLSNELLRVNRPQQ